MAPSYELGPEREALAELAQPSMTRGLLAVATSAVPYVILSIIMVLTINSTVVPTLLLIVPAAGFLVRTFVMFHDCTHGSLLPGKRANMWFGRVLGLFVLAPFARWRHDHAIHHGSSGDLDRRGVGDIVTLTTEEYLARPPKARRAYRIVRHPLVMFGVGPIIAMIVGPRIATRAQRPRLRHSVLLTDLALLVIATTLVLLLGWQTLLVVWAPPALLAGSAGIWLFYVQHQFDDAYWRRADDWSYAAAALQGSSYLRLPRVLQFFTGSIGLHHVHHLNARIPNYNLQRAHDENPVFHDVPTLSLRDGLRATRLKLWDEERGRLVGFRDARQPTPPGHEAGSAVPAAATL
jgi:omega-6 fatty acid desaturase (delta-12 desaturase)